MKQTTPEKLGFRTGQVIQATVLGLLMAVSILRLLSLSAEQQAFRYQGF
ncbi:MAG TPA: hypothetical protein VMF06_13635 [Candidatus Limnocylindria bacterium]|jgi:hypothetical protein|nr:hypothetical protein [Candidatus Limnocylindria bacterium]